MPTRMIKETIRTSRKINNLSDFQFRLWMYLITYVDDYGRGSADPELLKGFVFPRRKRVTEMDIDKALAELAGMGCINLYIVDGESYFYFPNWGLHQRIQTKKSKFPEPREDNLKQQESTVIHGEPRPESKPNTKQNNMSSKPDNAVPFSEIIDYLNLKAKTNYKSNTKETQRQINARFSDGFSLNDFKAVIDFKVSEWAENNEMSQYLRPQTLFGSKFESYLQNALKSKSGTVKTEVDYSKAQDMLKTFEQEMMGGGQI